VAALTLLAGFKLTLRNIATTPMLFGTVFSYEPPDTIPHFISRNSCSVGGKQSANSCHVSTLHLVRRVVIRTHRMTAYHSSSKSGRRASSNTQMLISSA
jgi:hypothetical protein